MNPLFQNAIDSIQLGIENFRVLTLTTDKARIEKVFGIAEHNHGR